MTPARILIRHGARAAEEHLLSRIVELRDLARADPALLARPVRVVVPSLSLRDHLAARLVESCGALAGFQVTTAAAVALEVLTAAGRRPGGGELLFDVLVRRFARLEPALHDRLDGLVDGYGAVTSTVRDLLNAGFEAVHHEPLAEFLGSDAADLATGDEIARARALLNVTRAVLEAFERLGLRHRSQLYAHARDALEEGGAELLPTRELWVHGFAEATGVVSDFLESLLRYLGGTLCLDRPPASDGGLESAHTQRFTIRLSQVARIESATVPPAAGAPPGSPATPSVLFLVAGDPDAELREAARRIREILETGARGESIALVARDLEVYGVRVRRHFGALGVPFSAPGAAGPRGRPGRDLALVLWMLKRGVELPLEDWLDIASDAHTGTETISQLRIALRARGAMRLRDLGRPELSEAVAREGGSPDLLRITAAGQALAGELASWAGERSLPFAEHRRRLRRLVAEHLGLRGEVATAHSELEAALGATGIPAELSLSYEELVSMVSEALRGRGAEPLGGRGGGVQVLSATEARSRTFDHLFLVGSSRDAFPRPVRADPLLPDRLRRGLRRVLPDLPIRSDSFDEERHLFAQLLSSAPRVTVSWPLEDADGKALAPSPLAERARMAKARRVAVSSAESDDPAVPWLRAPRLLDPAAPAQRPVEEELRLRAIHADRRCFAEVLPLALEEVAPAGAPVADLARSRLAVLEELDPDRRRREGRRHARRLGPYFGFLGTLPGRDDPRRTNDPRHRNIFITTLENLAVCPWQTFLRHLLRLEPMRDPLASLPTLRGLLLGRLVHRVLERVAGAARKDPPRERGVGVPWPDEARLEALLLKEAQNLLDERGLGFAGLARAAVEQARPYLETARRLDWADRSPRVRGVEVSGALRLSGPRGEERVVRFKADRLDEDDSGLCYTDYKTGGAGKPGLDLIDRVRRGEWLQAAAYARSGEGAQGRYVFLRPDREGKREIYASSSDEELQQGFERSVRTLLDAWDRGFFFPRLVEPHEDVEPLRCASCEVAQACLRRDSGARLRLRARAASLAESSDRSPEEEAFLSLWGIRL